MNNLRDIIARMDVFTIRASAAGLIMKDGKKEGTMGKTCTSYLDQWITDRLYNSRKEIGSKYFDKGNACEAAAIEMVGEDLGYFGLSKHEGRASDGLMSGECDVLAHDCIMDIKNSFDQYSFPLLKSLEESDDSGLYYAQGQVYMELYGKDAYKLCYCLMDMPDEMVEAEASKAAYKAGVELTGQLYDEVKARYTYSHLPIELRLKVFEFRKDEAYIAKLRARVVQCREYIAAKLQTLCPEAFLDAEISEDAMFDAAFTAIQADFKPAVASKSPEPVIAPPITEKPVKQAITMDMLIEAAHRLGGFDESVFDAEKGDFVSVRPSLQSVHREVQARPSWPYSINIPRVGFDPKNLHANKAAQDGKVDATPRPGGLWDIVFGFKGAKDRKAGLTEAEAVEYILKSKNFAVLKDALQAPPVATAISTDPDILPGQTSLF